MSELDDIRAIVAVINDGALSKAARHLGVSKSIVSRRVARLEADLGTRLLYRTTHGISATEAGLEFKVRGERILAELTEARDAVARHHGELAGRLRLALPLSFGIRYITPLLAKLAADHPRLEIEASYSDRHVDLVQEHFDAAVWLGDLRDSSLVTRRIAPLHVTILASPAYLSRHETPKVPTDLMEHECLIYFGPQGRSQWPFQVGRRRVTIAAPGRFYADNAEGLLRAAETGLGIAAVPSYLAADSIAAGRLVPLLTEFPFLDRAVYVVRPPGIYVSTKVRALIDLLVETFANDENWDRRATASTIDSAGRTAASATGNSTSAVSL
jgi:DNA-binding transcriptional LysR family regulator